MPSGKPHGLFRPRPSEWQPTNKCLCDVRKSRCRATAADRHRRCRSVENSDDIGFFPPNTTLPRG